MAASNVKGAQPTNPKRRVDIPSRHKLQSSPAPFQLPPQPPPDAPKTEDAEPSGLMLLLRIEAMARTAPDQIELHHLIVNETRKLNRARQLFLVDVSPQGAIAIVAVTGVAVPEARAALVDGVRNMMIALAKERPLSEVADFTLPAFCDGANELASGYPFREMLWVPFSDRGKRVFGGLLSSRENTWTKDEIAITTRLSETYAHALRELATAPAFRRQRLEWLKSKALIAIPLALALIFPVSITALAPAEIVAQDPNIVAAPIDGVIERIDVDPSTPVKAGDVLLRYSDITLRNHVEVARRDVAIAEAKLKQSTLLAIGDPRGRHELGIAQAELELKKAELAFAAEQLSRSVVKAPRAGIAVYADRKSLIGKPVATGERIMEIADPAHIEARIDLAVPDAMALRADSAVKLFLDVDPLRPLAGEVVRSDYRARTSDTDVLVFRTFAKIDTASRDVPRIGLRGTAQIYGGKAPLVVYLLRRPISAARQWLGL